MLDKFLKRFEKLETPSSGIIVSHEASSTKRFERLEVGSKRIEVTINDRARSGEAAPDIMKFYFFCPFCGQYNLVAAAVCAYCKKSIRFVLSPDRHEEGHLLKKCACGAMNQKDRTECWVCGKEFFLTEGRVAPKQTENTIILNIDGKSYKSTDTDLPSDILALMSRIRKEGYRKELIDEWVKERNQKIEDAVQNTESRLAQMRYGLFWRALVLVVFLLFIAFQLSTCFRYFTRS